MADKAWKRVEREKCRALGGERTGPRGFGLPDCVGLKVALEVKHYKRFVFLTKDWEQAVENAARVGLPPVLVVKEGGRGGRDEVKMRLDDYLALMARAILNSAYIPLAGKQAGTYARLSWPNFVRLYLAAYPSLCKEKIGI